MRRLLVLTGFVALAAVAAGVFVAATRSSADTPAKAATTRPAHHVLVVYRHHRGHGSPPARRIGNPRMHFHLVSEGAQGPDVLRLQQLLAKRGYLPVSFQAYGTQPPFELAPRHGRFSWRFHAPPELTSQWQPGVYSTITRGAVMTFEADHGMTIDGIAGQRVWQALVGPRTAPEVPYTYALVREGAPETITIYQTGRAPFVSPANTGIPQAPTALGTYPVYLRYTSTTMQGTNPDGTHYFDTGVPWVSYFNGGDAVHGFLRGSYGSPQSLGCVELPYAAAGTAYQLMNYGTLVTVAA